MNEPRVIVRQFGGGWIVYITRFDSLVDGLDAKTKLIALQKAERELCSRLEEVRAHIFKELAPTFSGK